MTGKIGFNKEKLRKLVRTKNDLHAAYVKLHGDIDFIRREQLPNLERIVRAADEHTQSAINREIYDARNENREPRKIKFFMKHAAAEMLAVYPNHPIRNHISLSNLQKYIACRQELESLVQHQHEISEKMTPLISLVARCKSFLEERGITDAECGIDLG